MEVQYLTLASSCLSDSSVKKDPEDTLNNNSRLSKAGILFADVRSAHLKGLHVIVEQESCT